MYKIDIKKTYENVWKVRPVVHCITNFVTVNDCANIVLAAGGSPTMAHDVREAAEITAGCNALVLNMGNVTDVDAMIAAGERSAACSHPVIFDPVGAGSSALRRRTAALLEERIHFSVVRGNATEIRQLLTGKGSTSGVDAAQEDAITEKSLPSFAKMAQELAGRLHCVVVISGKTDIAASEEKVYFIHNGCEDMTRVTGTGCMLSALTGAVCGGNPQDPLAAAVTALVMMGVAGERAKKLTDQTGGGMQTFHHYLLDSVSLLQPEILLKEGRYEEYRQNI